jgi:hypothetical protein
MRVRRRITPSGTVPDDCVFKVAPTKSEDSRKILFVQQFPIG